MNENGEVVETTGGETTAEATDVGDTKEEKPVHTGDMDLAQVLMIAICSVSGAYLAVKQKAV